MYSLCTHIMSVMSVYLLSYETLEASIDPDAFNDDINFYFVDAHT